MREREKGLCRVIDRHFGKYTGQKYIRLACGSKNSF